MSQGPSELLTLARAVVDRAGRGEQVEAYAQREVESVVSARDGEVESLSSAESRGVGIRVVVDGRQGYAWTAVVTQAGLEVALDEARSNAAMGMPDDANGLPAPQDPADVGDLVDPSYATTTVDDRIAYALDLERAAKAADRRVRGVDSAKYADSLTQAALASSEGAALTAERTDAWAYVEALATDGDETQAALGLTLGAGPAQLDIEAAGREAAERAVRLLGGRKPPSQRVPVVFDPSVTAAFLGVLAGALSAEAVLKGRSSLARRLGEELARADVSLFDDGILAGGPATSPWDGEGIARRKTALVEGGVLRSFMHDTWTARRTGGDAASTGNAGRAGFRSSPKVAPTNLYFGGDGRSPAELLVAAGDAVYVQDVMGLHSGADPVTGQFSVSMTGTLVRGGELVDAIREATVASTLVEVLRGLVEIADDRRFFPFGGALGGATVLIEQMSVGGT